MTFAARDGLLDERRRFKVPIKLGGSGNTLRVQPLGGDSIDHFSSDIETLRVDPAYVCILVILGA
jgi:hypothetical protein